MGLKFSAVISIRHLHSQSPSPKSNLSNLAVCPNTDHLRGRESSQRIMFEYATNGEVGSPPALSQTVKATPVHYSIRITGRVLAAGR